MTPRGRLSLILHAHLPAARHILRGGSGGDFDRNDPAVIWFWECLAGVYLPLIEVLRRVDAPLTLSLSPTLIEMARCPALHDGFPDFLARRREVGAVPEELSSAVDAQLRQSHAVEALWHDINGDLLGELRALDAHRSLELAVCAGTHAILPLVTHPEVRAMHVRFAVELFQDVFGRRPRFMWLPECGYTPGLEEQLSAEQVHCTVVEAVAISSANAPPVYGNYAPIVSGDVAFFGRDEDTAESVWSASRGFPGDAWYREFHRELSPGVKPWRVTGRDDKLPWDPLRAAERALAHAGSFVADVGRRLARATTALERPAHVTAAYDAELFGHWWYEGPIFLRHVLEQSQVHESFELSTPVAFLETVRIHQQATPAPSTWGRDADFSWWVDESTDWIYSLTSAAENVLLQSEPDAAAIRELLLAQCSDWPFAIRNVTFADYARGRIHDHIDAFYRLTEGDPGSPAAYPPSP